MIEIKITLDEIDYSGIAELALPIVKEKLAGSDNFISGLVGKHIPEAALSGTLKCFLKLLTPEQKDEVALSLINKYEDKIVELMQKTASDKGVNIAVKGLSANKADDSN